MTRGAWGRHDRAARLVYLTETDPIAWEASYASGAVSTPWAYGAQELAASGVEARQLGYAVPRRGSLRRLDGWVSRRLGFPLWAAAHWAPAFARTRWVLAALEHAAPAPALLQRRGWWPFARPTLAVLTCWLAQELREASPQHRRALAERYRGVDLFLVLSSNQGPLFADAGIDPDRVVSVPFGVATDFFHGDPDAERDIDLLSVGRDWGRDYQTLFDAVGGTELRALIVAAPDALPASSPPTNVEVLGRVPAREYADLLRRAKVVVVPVRDFAYPTGQSVALEAAAAGCAIVVSDTRPLRDYFCDGVNALMVPPGDPVALRAALRSVLRDPELRLRLARAGHEHVRQHHSLAAMWSAVAEVLARVPAAARP